MKKVNTTHEITVGQIVKSKAGRDKDRAFIVIGIVDEQYVLIADGDLRKIDKAKKKKVKHLQKYNIISNEVKKRIENDEKISNLFLRRELEKLGLS
ncbi:KOW domain-containing RNA-binding protein [Crassaminicella indica]|uniref:KOW domain-containing RNA-binding protein n=1 Tax=Crassaminicella indica TaxID=2855394 RepID=A0ABX8RE27_9CLOT|nr:KOW domain-containing RNA-binding protein [Crassaminicella indica]QXM07333.1 KOW domain-containing RNA-binding protein [Crassaminicella indica]